MNMGLQIVLILLLPPAVITTSTNSGNNVTITRKKHIQDIFTKPNLTAECEEFKAGKTADPTRCKCDGDYKTFMVNRSICVTDMQFLTQMNIEEAFVAFKPRPRGKWTATCPSNFFTFDITSKGKKKLQICSRIDNYPAIFPICTLSAKYLDERKEEWINITVIAQLFTVNLTNRDGTNKIIFKWSEINEELRGAILWIDVKCNNITGHLIFKTVGDKTWFNYLPTTATEISSFGTSHSPRTSNEFSTEKPSPSQMPGKGTSGKMGGENGNNTLTVIVPVVIGIIVSVILICVFIWFMIRKRRKRERSTPCDNVENSENLTYGRGPDNVMTTSKKSNKNTEEDTNYQPIVQNTRASGQPTYEALSGNKQRQPPQNPSIYQALNPDKPAPVQQQSKYEPLVKHRNLHHKELPHEGKSSHESQGDTERDYAVLEGPSEGTDRVEAPVYQVLEQGQEKGSPQENNHDEPVYNVLEAE